MTKLVLALVLAARLGTQPSTQPACIFRSLSGCVGAFPGTELARVLQFYCFFTRVILCASGY
jgi:hypothetical protein